MTAAPEAEKLTWLATATQIGTGQRMVVRGDTKDAVDLQLFGQAYAAEHGTIRYYRERAEA